LFISIRIHIYDFTTNTKNDITFKIRKLDNNVVIKDKFNQVAEEMNKQGIKIQSHIPDHFKKW